MKTIYTYTNSTMAGREFVIVQDNGEDGYYITGNSASTSENMSSYDMTVQVKNKKELKNIVDRLEWVSKYSNKGRK